jgi:hypothetical protein
MHQEAASLDQESLQHPSHSRIVSGFRRPGFNVVPQFVDPFRTSKQAITVYAESELNDATQGAVADREPPPLASKVTCSHQFVCAVRLDRCHFKSNGTLRIARAPCERRCQQRERQSSSQHAYLQLPPVRISPYRPCRLTDSVHGFPREYTRMRTLGRDAGSRRASPKHRRPVCDRLTNGRLRSAAYRVIPWILHGSHVPSQTLSVHHSRDCVRARRPL